ncbi:unnamed protein product [Effrenium voratum]|nr:unnamed protein product [Effrenium voratum]
MELPENGTNPCLSPAKSPGPLQRLSCMARRSQVALVANLVEQKDCWKTPFRGCVQSRDGWLLLNTAVVLDADGTFLVKYHKAHLWGEHALDASQECSTVSFRIKDLDVPFGVFICADLIYSWPSLQLVNEGIRHFVMPLSWSNEMAQMQPLGWQQAWSRANSAVLLAANTRSASTSGSGIFVRGLAAAKAYALDGLDDELLVAEVPQRLEGEPPETCALGRLPPPARPHWSQWLSFPLDFSVKNEFLEERSQTFCSNFQPGVSMPTCCRVRFRARPGRGYVVALLNGLDYSPGTDSWAAEACAVLPCSDDGATDCLTYPTEALKSHGAKWFGEFEFLQLEVNFSSPQLVFPQVLVGRDRLLPPSEWNLESHGTWQRLTLSGAKARDVVSLQLYGRPYTKDPSPGCPCQDGIDILA